MDPITMAIIAAITAGATTAATSVVQQSINDAYNFLKSVLEKKLGSQSGVLKAIGDTEKKPQSEGRKIILGEEITESQILNDSEILSIARQILELVSKQDSSLNNSQIASGSYIAQADHKSTANVNVNTANKHKRKSV